MSQHNPGRIIAAATPTIRDVAARAGVSVTTVSHALSGNRAVAPGTRERVRQAVDDLQYRANPSAHSLRTGTAHVISLVVPDIANPFFADVAGGVEEFADAEGWNVLLCNSALRADREMAHLQRAAAGGVDGVVYCSTSPHTKALRSMLEQQRGRIPIVVCDEAFGGPGDPGVFSANVAGGRMAAEHLLAVGCRRIAVIGGPKSLPTARERVRGFTQAMRGAGIVTEPSMVRAVPYLMSEGVTAMSEILLAHPDVDGVFAADDLLALGAQNAVLATGRSVPDDVAICGFDGISWGAMVSPSLTTIAQQTHQLGYESARLLLQLVRGEPVSSITVVLPVSLVQRQSTNRSVTQQSTAGRSAAGRSPARRSAQRSATTAGRRPTAR